MDWIWIWET